MNDGKFQKGNTQAVRIRTVLIGLGTVDLGLLNILIGKSKEIENHYNLEFMIVGVADSSGLAVNPAGYPAAELLELKKKKKRVSSLSGYLPGIAVESVTEYVQGELLIESSSANLKTGFPGLQVVRHALKNGWSVVLANKAPLVFAFDELHRMAEQSGARLAFSATVCGGLPVINVLQRDLKFASLRRLRGILNATTNFILQELNRGGTIEAAIAEAQRLGAAEADPSHDVHGHDTANKLFIIMKAFTDFDGDINDIKVEGLQNLTQDERSQAKAKSKQIKLLAFAEKIEGQWNLSVKPAEVSMGSFLGSCDGWEMGIEIETDLYESIAMKNYEADPVGTSAAVLRDAIDVSISTINKREPSAIR